jgi:hypothetical protein
MPHYIRRTLIVSIRSIGVAIFAAFIGISAPIIGLADGISTPTPVVQQQEGSGMWGWVTSKAVAVNQLRADKWANLTDPDQKIKLLQATISSLEVENVRLNTELTVQELRVQIRTQDLITLRESISALNLLFVTGRMKQLIEVVPDVRPVAPPE